MVLAVRPGSGEVQILMSGGLCEKDGEDPLEDEESMEMLRKAFVREAKKQWNLLPENVRLGRRCSLD